MYRRPLARGCQREGGAGTIEPQVSFPALPLALSLPPLPPSHLAPLLVGNLGLRTHERSRAGRTAAHLVTAIGDTAGAGSELPAVCRAAPGRSAPRGCRGGIRP